MQTRFHQVLIDYSRVARQVMGSPGAMQAHEGSIGGFASIREIFFCDSFHVRAAEPRMEIRGLDLSQAQHVTPPHFVRLNEKSPATFSMLEQFQNLALHRGELRDCAGVVMQCVKHGLQVFPLCHNLLMGLRQLVLT